MFASPLIAGEWEERIANAECSQIKDLFKKLNQANNQLHESCRGATLNHSDRCQGKDLAQAFGEVKSRLAQCRKAGQEIEGINF